MKRINFTILVLTIIFGAISSNSVAMKRPADCAAEDYADMQEELTERCTCRIKTNNGYKPHAKKIARKRMHEETSSDEMVDTSDDMVDAVEFVQPEEKRIKSEDANVEKKNMFTPKTFEELLESLLQNKYLFILWATTQGEVMEMTPEIAEIIFSRLTQDPQREDLKKQLNAEFFSDNNADVFFDFVLRLGSSEEEIFEGLKQELQEQEETELCKRIAALSV